MFARRKTQVGEERSSRKAPLGETEVRELIAAVDVVVLARGKRTERRPAREVKPGDLLGPTGKYRAPMVRSGRTLLVGFHTEALEALLREA